MRFTKSVALSGLGPRLHSPLSAKSVGLIGLMPRLPQPGELARAPHLFKQLSRCVVGVKELSPTTCSSNSFTSGSPKLHSEQAEPLVTQCRTAAPSRVRHRTTATVLLLAVPVPPKGFASGSSLNCPVGGTGGRLEALDPGVSQAPRSCRSSAKDSEVPAGDSEEDSEGKSRAPRSSSGSTIGRDGKKLAPESPNPSSVNSSTPLCPLLALALNPLLESKLGLELCRKVSWLPVRALVGKGGGPCGGGAPGW